MGTDKGINSGLQLEICVRVTGIQDFMGLGRLPLGIPVKACINTDHNLTSVYFREVKYYFVRYIFNENKLIYMQTK